MRQIIVSHCRQSEAALYPTHVIKTKTCSYISVFLGKPKIQNCHYTHSHIIPAPKSETIQWTLAAQWISSGMPIMKPSPLQLWKTFIPGSNKCKEEELYFGSWFQGFSPWRAGSTVSLGITMRSMWSRNVCPITGPGKRGEVAPNNTPP